MGVWRNVLGLQRYHLRSWRSLGVLKNFSGADVCWGGSHENGGAASSMMPVAGATMRLMFASDWIRSSASDVPGSAVSQGRELDEDTFGGLADNTLQEMLSAFEDYLEEIDLDDGDIDFGQGVLTLKLGSKGTYVINKQSPNRQIWLSSPLSGPFRYDYIDGCWRYHRDGHKMVDKLREEVEKLCGKPIAL